METAEWTRKERNDYLMIIRGYLLIIMQYIVGWAGGEGGIWGKKLKKKVQGMKKREGGK
mgnify:CR=1 FL=1